MYAHATDPIRAMEQKEFVRDLAEAWHETSTGPREPKVQADQVKETRLKLAKVAAAMDGEIIAAAIEFADWAETLKRVDWSTCPACCKAVGSS